MLGVFIMGWNTESTSAKVPNTSVYLEILHGNLQWYELQACGEWGMRAGRTITKERLRKPMVCKLREEFLGLEKWLSG